MRATVLAFSRRQHPDAAVGDLLLAFVAQSPSREIFDGRGTSLRHVEMDSVNKGVVSALNILGSCAIGDSPLFFGNCQMLEFMSESHAGVGDCRWILPNGVEQIMF